MSFAELRPVVSALPRRDKFLLVQELAAELSQEEGGTVSEYPVWSPYERTVPPLPSCKCWIGRKRAPHEQGCPVSFFGRQPRPTRNSLMPLLRVIYTACGEN